MNIKILGCSGGKTIERSPTSFIVDDRLLVDAGSVMNKLDTEELLNIEHLVLTHSHFDHIADLPFLVLMYFEERKEDFHVFASDITTEWIFSHVLNGKIWPDLFAISMQNWAKTKRPGRVARATRGGRAVPAGDAHPASVQGAGSDWG